jgi:hypothetical protein
MSDDRVESLIAEGIDRIALPSQSTWLPDAGRRGASNRLAPFARFALGVTVFLVAVGIGLGLRSIRQDAGGPPATLASATPSPSSATGSSASPITSASPAPSATRTPPDPVWSQLRAQMSPGTPIIEPTWLPPVFGNTKAELSDVRSGSAADSRYTVTYRAGSISITFALGPQSATPSDGRSAMGGSIRRSWGTLSFPSDLFAHPGANGLRILSWAEGAYSLRIETETLSGNDLLHVGWSLDLSGAPNPSPEPARAAAGTCADSASPEMTVRRLVGLIGSQDPVALAECFAIGATGFAGPWAAGPRATFEAVDSLGPVGGRVQLRVKWLFASNPGGPANIEPVNFVILGQEDGFWRVFDVNTAPLPTPP